MSNMDDAYESIFGHRPKKRGSGYELIVACVLKCLYPHMNVSQNVRLSNSYSGNTNQIDVFCTNGNHQIHVEAKDWSESDEKTGRPEVERLAGATLLFDHVSQAVLASSTDFSDDAKTYSDDLSRTQKAVPIDLFYIRESTPKDEEGRARTIVFNIRMTIPDLENAQWTPYIDRDEIDADLASKLGQGVYVHYFYDESGNVIDTVRNISTHIFSGVTTGEERISGTWKFTPGTHVYIGDDLVPVLAMKFDIPILNATEQRTIEADEPGVLVQSRDHNIDQLISITRLKKAHEEISKNTNF